MGSKKEKLPVFTQTNLGTRIAIAVSPDNTVRKFKGELERAHIGCYPELGSLSIDAVMVKRNSYFYHLPDLLPLKHVFQDFPKSWFLHVNASILNLSDTKNCTKVCQNSADIKSNKMNLDSKAVLLGAAVVSTACPSRKKRKRKKRHKVRKYPERFSCERLEQEPKENIYRVCKREGLGNCGQQEVLHPNKVPDSNDTRPAAESPCGSLSGAVSVSGIIDRYFPNFINVDYNQSASSSEVAKRSVQCHMDSFSKNSSKKRSSVKPRQRLLPSLLPEDLNYVAQKSQYERSEVGERLVVASNNLWSSQRSTLSKGKKLFKSNVGSVIRNLMFEIDTDD